MIEDFRRAVDDGVDALDPDDRGQVVDQRLPQVVLRSAGTESGSDAARQAAELWVRLDEDDRSTVALALLMHRTTRLQAWPPGLTVLRYALDPDPGGLPDRSWD